MIMKTNATNKSRMQKKCYKYSYQKLVSAYLKWLKLGRVIISYKQKSSSAVTTSSIQRHVY